MWEKFKTAFIKATSDVEVDDKGNEHIIPWSFKEFIWEQFLIWSGIIIGAILF